MDVFGQAKRSNVMGAVRSRNTEIEIRVRRYLTERGLTFQKHVASLPGSPDIVLPQYRAAIFINGCFWHGHRNCPDFRLPQTDRDFWIKKINTNVFRDAKNRRELAAAGWMISTLWGCRLKEDFAQEMLVLEQTLLKKGPPEQNPGG